MDKANTTTVAGTIERLCYIEDGDSIAVVLDDFVDLQESPTYFLSDREAAMVRPWIGRTVNPLVHLPWATLARIAEELEAKLVIPET